MNEVETYLSRQWYSKSIITKSEKEILNIADDGDVNLWNIEMNNVYYCISVDFHSLLCDHMNNLVVKDANEQFEFGLFAPSSDKWLI